MFEDDYEHYEEDDEPMTCPECGSELTSKWGGVECSSSECDYWFCF